MLRRALALLLTLASVIATAMPAADSSLAAPATCCCGDTCGGNCQPRDCAPAPAPAHSPASTATLEQRAAAAKPAARVALAFASPSSFSEKISARRARVSHAAPSGAAVSVALFQAHCSLRL